MDVNRDIDMDANKDKGIGRDKNSCYPMDDLIELVRCANGTYIPITTRIRTKMKNSHSDDRRDSKEYQNVKELFDGVNYRQIYYLEKHTSVDLHPIIKRINYLKSVIDQFDLSVEANKFISEINFKKTNKFKGTLSINNKQIKIKNEINKTKDNNTE